MKKGSHGYTGLHGSCQKKQGKKKRGGVQWDEHNLEENERIKLELNPTKIDEPKTPYHYREEDSLSDDSLEISPLSLSDDAVAHHHRNSRRTSMFERQLDCEGEDEELDEGEKRKKFLEARKQHYKVGRHLLSTTRTDEDEDHFEEEEE